MDWLKNLLGKQEPEQPQPALEPVPPVAREPEPEEQEAPTFTEIGGSPCRG